MGNLERATNRDSGAHAQDARLAAEQAALPNTLSIGIQGMQASKVLEALSESVAASAGAACHSSAPSVSAVLKAMDVPLEFAVGTLRLSVGRHTTAAEVRRAAELISAQVPN